MYVSKYLMWCFSVFTGLWDGNRAWIASAVHSFREWWAPCWIFDRQMETYTHDQPIFSRFLKPRTGVQIDRLQTLGKDQPRSLWANAELMLWKLRITVLLPAGMHGVLFFSERAKCKRSKGRRIRAMSPFVKHMHMVTPEKQQHFVLGGIWRTGWQSYQFQLNLLLGSMCNLKGYSDVAFWSHGHRDECEMLRCSKSLKCAAGSNRTVFCMEKEVLLGGANWIYQNQTIPEKSQYTYLKVMPWEIRSLKQRTDWNWSARVR